MPSAQSHSGHPQQRRTFRGRGGPTDGNLPPKKNLRHRVKYQAAEESSNDQTGTERDDNQDVDDADAASTMIERHVDQLSITTDRNECNDIRVKEDKDGNDKLLLELTHLRQRMQQLVDSFQTCQGMGNLNTWRTNCLLPTKNAVKEWRSIVKFYNLLEIPSHNYGVNDNDRKEVRDCEQVGHININDINNISSVEDAVGADGSDTMNIINSSTQEVFGLIQMSVQVGPLSGSNPGYFKRCGWEVASIGMTYLDDIVDLASQFSFVDNAVDGTTSSIFGGAKHSCFEGRVLNEKECHGENMASSTNISCSENHEDEECIRSDNNCILSESESSCDLTQDHYDDERWSHAEGVDVMLTGQPSSNGALRRRDVTSNLQDSFLFTEKQSAKFYQWMCNAENAVRKNKPPSKSAVKLQSLRSKKQKQKELKMERKMKKKKSKG